MNEWRKSKRPSQSPDVLKWRKDNWLRLAVADAKRRAKRKGLEFDLDYKDIEVPVTCPLLGIPLYRAGGRATDNTPSLDRIDNTRGYTKDNVWVVSWRANSIKRDSTPRELIRISTILANMFPELTNATTQIQNKPSQETI
jgi:hypothetical protein